VPVHIEELTTAVELTGRGDAAPAASPRPVPVWEERDRVRRSLEALRRDATRTSVEDAGA
jgi:hypothetical protein